MADDTSGIVRRVRRRQLLAPSTSEASIRSVGMPSSAAEKRRNENAAPRHALARLTASIGLLISQVW